MKLTHLTAILLCTTLAACGSKPDYETLSGETGRFKDYHGRWLLVNYWAEWCKPCIKEMPELKNFSDQYAQTAAVVTVNFDGASGETLQQQVRKLNIQVPVLLNDPAPLLGIERPLGLPTTYVFNPDGKFVTRLEGEQTVATLAAAIAPSNAHP